MSSSQIVLSGITGLVLFIALYVRHARRTSHLPLPPGPKKLPLVGNLFQIPSSFEWETYAEWSKIYGSDILHINVAGRSIIIVNSLEVAADLFEKRSTIYSSRATTPMLHDLIKFDWLFGAMPYGEPWKVRRRFFQQHFHPQDAASHHSKELEHTHKLLKQLLETPEHFYEHIRNAIGAMTLSIAYGLDIKPFNDPYIEIAEKALIALSDGAIPGAFLVDSIPIMKYIPSWFPGASFKRKAAEWRVWATKIVEVPFEDAQKAIAAGGAPSSFVATCLSDLDQTQDITAQIEIIRDTAASFFVGGADTSVSSMVTFILMMACYPYVQAKAQRELDRVLGKGVLPTFNDESSLPYITAILKEVQRRHPVLPLGVPHYSTEDDEYNGYFIPKNSLIVGNTWAILTDENDYPDPLAFRPERFMTPDGTKLDPNVREPSAAFGFGRRVCAGEHLALSMLFIGMASILALFDISKEIDGSGNVIEPTKEFTSSIISHPKPFKCRIQPRSSEAKRLIISL